MQNPHNNAIPRKVYSVSQLTDQIKLLLEDNYSMVWISGEISNLRVPPSGHAYFTLKDNKAQISAVMFRGQLRQLRFDLEDGLVLVGLGRITVYPPRGNYQIILEYVEPQGAGALQLAFEQLKRKLSEQGLFSEDQKTPLPYLPRRIGVITSPTGAVIQDIIRVLTRRYYNLIIDVYPVRVQGLQSPDEVIRAISFANRLKRSDVLIIARGGGSLEDLSPFNDEGVAHAIFESSIPIVSAIGHETDYTIADFVADLRAPTPSAAAEIVVPVKEELHYRIDELQARLERAIWNRCDRLRQQLSSISRHIVHPGKKLADLRLHVDHLGERAIKSMAAIGQQHKNRLEKAVGALLASSPKHRIDLHKSKVELLRLKILQTFNNRVSDAAKRFKTANALLGAVNPSAILKRGYSITRTLPDRQVVMEAGTLNSGQILEIQLAAGKVDVRVIKPKDDPDQIEE